jgi:protein ImuA
MVVASSQMPIAELRHWLARMESHSRASAAVLPFGLAEVDAHVPGGGLQLGHLHEVIEGGSASEYAGLATLFAAGVVARLAGPVLWCLRGRDLFAPALARIGLHPDRVINCETWKDREVLPASAGQPIAILPRSDKNCRRLIASPVVQDRATSCLD